MLPRLGTGVGMVILMLLATTTLLPAVGADHAYSHRYVIFGRVVDADGNPVPGLTVKARFDEHLAIEGSCADQPETDTDAFGRTNSRPVTNEHGEFMFCTHLHSMHRSLPGKAYFLVDEVNQTHEIELDPYYRVSFVPIKLSAPHERANAEALGATYTVIGRLWREMSEDRVEGIRVFGETVDQTPVNVTLAYNDGKTATISTKTNNYGDFAVRIPVEARPTSGTVTVEALGQSFQAPVDATVGTTAIKAELDPVTSDTLKNVLTVGGTVVLVGATVGCSYVVFRRVAAKREEAAIRATAQRKRANK